MLPKALNKHSGDEQTKGQCKPMKVSVWT